jgi:hypothetical protein
MAVSEARGDMARALIWKVRLAEPPKYSLRAIDGGGGGVRRAPCCEPWRTKVAARHRERERG